MPRTDNRTTTSERSPEESLAHSALIVGDPFADPLEAALCSARLRDVRNCLTWFRRALRDQDRSGGPARISQGIRQAIQEITAWAPKERTAELTRPLHELLAVLENWKDKDPRPGGPVTKTILAAYDKWRNAHPGQTYNVICDLGKDGRIVGADGEYWRGAWKAIARAAKLRTVLILGGSGTGKELVARAVHEESRREGRFVSLNCASLNENLQGSELFGHVKGAFTGAMSDRPGRFKAADQGTLFLDEVGDMPQAMQAKLLRALDRGEVTPVGLDTSITVDVLVVAATNADLAAKIRNHTFRDDLCARLTGDTIQLKPLNERREDIPHLVAYFAEVLPNAAGGSPVMVADDLLMYLVGRDWAQKNVRGLRDDIDRAIITASDRRSTVLKPEDFEDTGSAPVPSEPSATALPVELLRRFLACGGKLKEFQEKVKSGGVLTGVHTWKHFTRRYNELWQAKLEELAFPKRSRKPWAEHSRAARKLGQARCRELARQQLWPDVVEALKQANPHIEYLIA